MVDSIECFTKINKTADHSRGLLLAVIKISMYKVQHLDEVVVYAAAREPT